MFKTIARKILNIKFSSKATLNTPPTIIKQLAKLIRVNNFKGKGIIAKQIRRLIKNKDYVDTIQFDLGEYIHLHLNDWIDQQIYTEGIYSVEKYHTMYFRNLLKPGWVFFDIGANIGYYTLQASMRVGKKGKIYSFEPVSKTLKNLRSNIKLNKFENIDTFQYIISDIGKTTRIYIGDETNTGTSRCSPQYIKNTQNYESIKSITVDDFVELNRINKIELIKIDVEGYEMKVLLGMRKSIAKYHPTLLVEINTKALAEHGDTPQELFNYFYKNGYKSWYITNKQIINVDKYIKDDNLVLFRYNL